MRERDTHPGGGRLRPLNKGTTSREPSRTISGRKTVPLPAPLKKNRIYVRTPDNYYSHHPDDPRDVTSSYHREYAYVPTNLPKSPKSESQNDRLLGQPTNAKRVKKAMVIGEQPSMYKMDYRRPELPGNLFVDNLRQQKIDWRQYDSVTWNDVLGSHVKDVQAQPRDHAQTRPQREAWLASIDERVRNNKMNSHRGLPGIAPRLFNSKVKPAKPPVHARYISRNREGDLFYLVGPSEVTKKDHRPFILPEIVRPETPTQKYLNF